MLIFLVGYAGSGKSSMGRRIARRLNVRFVDTDQCIEQNEGASIADIFHYQGEEYFRTVERSTVERVADECSIAVVSTGGGLPAWGDNMEWMRERGLVIYLKRSAEQILSRMSPYGREKRPLFRGKSDEELIEFMREHMSERECFYAKAHITVDCNNRSDYDVQEYIVQRLIELCNE